MLKYNYILFKLHGIILYNCLISFLCIVFPYSCGVDFTVLMKLKLINKFIVYSWCEQAFIVILFIINKRAVIVEHQISILE